MFGFLYVFLQEAGGELDLEDMAFGMSSFVNKVSSHTGAEFPWLVTLEYNIVVPVI